MTLEADFTDLDLVDCPILFCAQFLGSDCICSVLWVGNSGFRSRRGGFRARWTVECPGRDSASDWSCHDPTINLANNRKGKGIYNPLTMKQEGALDLRIKV